MAFDVRRAHGTLVERPPSKKERVLPEATHGGHASRFNRIAFLTPRILFNKCCISIYYFSFFFLLFYLISPHDDFWRFNVRVFTITCVYRGCVFHAIPVFQIRSFLFLSFSRISRVFKRSWMLFNLDRRISRYLSISRIEILKYKDNIVTKIKRIKIIIEE